MERDTWRERQEKEAKAAQIVTVEDMATALGYKLHDNFDTDYLWSSAYQASKANGLSDEDASEAAQRACDEEDGRLYVAERDEVVRVFSKMMEDHDLEVRAFKSRKRMGYYHILPKESWRTSMLCIIKTINGHGPFYFSSSEEFITQGPYFTPRIATLLHLHWCKKYPRVYGEKSYDRLITFE